MGRDGYGRHGVAQISARAHVTRSRRLSPRDASALHGALRTSSGRWNGKGWVGERERKRDTCTTEGESRERASEMRARLGIDVPSCARNYGPACSQDAVVLNWLTATKFDGGVCFSSFILILRESTPPPPLPLPLPSPPPPLECIRR